MSLVIDDAYLPATLTAAPMTDDEFVEFCAQFPDCIVEMSAEGGVLIMPPGDFLTSAQGLPADKPGLWDRKKRPRFPPFAPDFLVELRSPYDRLSRLRPKMREWIENGCSLAWLVDPERRAVEIYRPGVEPEMLTGAESVAGAGPVEGFILDLWPVWDPAPR